MRTSSSPGIAFDITTSHRLSISIFLPSVQLSFSSRMIFLFSRRKRRRRGTWRICQLGCYFLVFSLMRTREFTNTRTRTHTHTYIINTLSTVLSKWTKWFFLSSQRAEWDWSEENKKRQFFAVHAVTDQHDVVVCTISSCYRICWLERRYGEGGKFYARFSFNRLGRRTSCCPIVHLVNQLLPLEKETAQAFTSCELRTINSSLHILFLHFFYSTVYLFAPIICWCCRGHFEIYFSLSSFCTAI